MSVRAAWKVVPVLVVAVLGLGVVGAGDEKAQKSEKKEAELRTITNSIGQKLVLIPAGEFLMGSKESVDELDRLFPGYKIKTKTDLFEDETQHRVRITKPFYLGKYEVTIGQFRQFTKDTGYLSEAEKEDPPDRPEKYKRPRGGWGINAKTGKFEGRRAEYTWKNPGYPQGEDHPVVNVTWNDAVAFCKWLSKKEGKVYRLPTEAEWEYACRAGTTTRYHSGDDKETLIKVANIADASGSAKGKREFPDWDDFALSGSDGYTFTAPVGSFRPNAWGLHDIHGNVWEWCSDWYGEDYYKKSPRDDPQGPASGDLRVRRGGAWHTYPLYVRSAFRNINTPHTRYLNLGFRVARNQ